jgi:GGDEF domain-containing protein
MRAPGLASAGSSEGEHASFGERALGERGAFGEREPGADVPGATRDRTDPDLPLGPRPLGHVPRRGARPVALVDEQEDATEAIEIKDVRSGAHPPVTVAIQRRLERFSDDRTPFTVLLVEVLDAERLRTLRASGDLLRELWAIESAIAEQLRPADTLLREIDGRWWLIAPNTDSFSARELAERLASAARRFAHRGTPLGVVVGIAVCPEHGLDAATLIGHADIDLYAAQAAGRSVGGFDDGEDRSA